MGYDLYSRSDDATHFRWNIWGWGPILTLAETYGWEGCGTTIEPITEDDMREHDISQEEADKHNTAVLEWSGTYFGNDGQLVSSEDALAIAVALEQSLDDIPDFDIPAPGQKEDGMVSVTNEANAKHRASLNAGSRPALTIEFSGKDNKTYIKKFIKFLRKGAFNIH